MQLPPLSLYIHVPWCVKKCPYCDFNSHAARGEIPEQQYIDALIRDLEREANACQGRPIQSIFIGGGTPSLLTGQAISQLLQSAAEVVEFTADIEITMEANPGTFETERFAEYLAGGVNRLSIGVQSFNSQHLEALGRIHSGDEAVTAITTARALGFKRINVDLMHGLPGQSPEQALSDIQQAIALEPDHLSWYQLTIEPNTEFHVRPPVLPEDDDLWDIQQQGQKLIATAGFQQYEVSAYAKPGQQARHNINYWQFGDYLGIGAGAHGKLSFPEQDLILRRWKQRSPKAYLNSIDPLGGETPIEREDRRFEFMINALRLLEGAPVQSYLERTGLARASLEPLWGEAQQQGLMVEGEQLATTERGQLFLNTLLERFL